MKKRKMKKTNYTGLFIKTIILFISVEAFIGMMAVTLFEKLFF